MLEHGRDIDKGNNSGWRLLESAQEEGECYELLGDENECGSDDC